MRILITGAAGNIGRGMIPRLRAAGHELVLTDLIRPPVASTDGLEFVQCDIQTGFGLAQAAQGCDLILHTAAWHGIHSGEKSELDYWRLNVDGTFWVLEAARAAHVDRLVFLSSLAWHDAYGKYGFTKRIGEELCEYARRNRGMRYVALRPADFTPWGNDWVNRYGARLLYGGVDRVDVLDSVEAAVLRLESDQPPDEGPEGIVAEVVRPNAFTEDDVAAWEDDPVGACERVFPGSGRLVEKYALDVSRKPVVVAAHASRVLDCTPSRHFGTFVAELQRLDEEGGEAAVRAVSCPY